MPIETLYSHNYCEWIDCQAPTAEDLHYLHDRYGINKLLLEDTTDRNHLPKFEENNGIKFFLTRENATQGRPGINSISDVSTKVGIFVTDKTMITVHRMADQNIAGLQATLQKQPPVNENQIALQLALKILQTYETEARNLAEIMDNAENEIFTKNVKDGKYIQRLYQLKRKISLNSRILAVSADWVNNFKKLKLSEAELTDLVDTYKALISEFDHLGGQITGLISMFIALSDQRANQVMKLLAMYSVYFLPISFIAGLYGMNFKFIPELEYQYGYFAVLGVMATIVICTYIYFKRKKWQ